MGSKRDFKIRDELTLSEVQEINKTLGLANAYAFLAIILYVITFIMLINLKFIFFAIFLVLAWIASYQFDVLFKKAKKLASDD